jgi:hypothetical protein
MSSRYLTWQRGGGLIVGDGLSTGPASPAVTTERSPGFTADRQAAGRAGDEPSGDGSGTG